MYGGNGLGQTDDEFLGSRDFLLRMINSLDADLARFPPEGSIANQARVELGLAKQWFQGAISLFYDQANNSDAMRSLGIGTRHAHAASKLIQKLDPRSEVAKRAEQETRRGASFTYQLGQTVARPVAAALETISPALAATVLSNWWIVPAVSAGLLFVFLRR